MRTLIAALIVVAGLAGFVYGVALVYEPAAWIIGGLLAAAGGLLVEVGGGK